MNIKDIGRYLKSLGYRKLNSKYGISIFVKDAGLLFSQAIAVASPNPKSTKYDFEIGILNIPLEISVLDIEQAKFIGVYSLHYGWKVGEISGKSCLPDESEQFYRDLEKMDKEISSEIEKINTESTEALTSFRENTFFAQHPIRKYGSYAAFRGVIYSVIEKGYLDPAIENSALCSVSSDLAEFKQLEFKLGLLKQHIAITTTGLTV